MPEAATKTEEPAKTCPECGGLVWDRDSAQNHVRQHWPRSIDAQPQNAKAAVRRAYLLQKPRPAWTEGELAADAEATKLGVDDTTEGSA